MKLFNFLLKLREKIKEQTEKVRVEKARKMIEQKQMRSLLFYFDGYNNRSTFWEKNLQGDRVRNKHKFY